jgi:Ca-activated chloride channel family protein
MVSSAVGTAVAAGSVILEVGADCPVVKSGTRERVTVRALVRPLPRERSVRAPLAVAIVIDKSGSMNADGKMENAKLGAVEALEALDSRDMAAVVVYDSEAATLIKAVPAGDTDMFRRRISRVTAGGNTALYDGVSAGAREISRLAGDGYIPRVILLSDGLANVGPSSAREISELGRRLSREDMTITTIGLGLDYDEDIMTSLASGSGGNSYFAKDSRTLVDIFRRDMKDAVALTARRVKITFESRGGARPLRAVGRGGNAENGTIEIDIDNLYGGDKYALFELEIPEGEDGAVLDAGTARVEYIDAFDGSSVTLSSPLEIRYSSDGDYAEKNRDAEIISQAEMARNAEIREEAVRLTDSGQGEAAAKLLRERSGFLKSIAPTMASPQAVEEEISDFEEMSLYIEENDSMSNEQRKQNLNKAHITKNQQSEDESGPNDGDEE